MKWNICPPIEDRLQDTVYVRHQHDGGDDPSLCPLWTKGSSPLIYSSSSILMSLYDYCLQPNLPL